MCTQYHTGSLGWRRTATAFGLDVLDFEDRDIRPTDSAPVLYCQNGRIVATRARFGFTASGGGLVLNARSETVETKPMFGALLAKGRAIVLADRFYEWDVNKFKYAFFAQDTEPLWMAALVCQEWDGLHCVILTQPALPPVEKIHDRMPLCFTKQQAKSWLLQETDLQGIVENQSIQLACRLAGNAPHQLTFL